MQPLPQPDDVFWTRVRHQGGEQWIRVVIEHAYAVTNTFAVRALFPGDSFHKVWVVNLDDLQAEEPSYDQLSAVEDGGDFECV